MNLEQPQLETTLGNKIRNKRLEIGYSQQELMTDRYSAAYLSRVERDQMQPSDKFLAFIAERLGVTSADLIENTVKATPKPKRLPREAQEHELNNAHIALQSHQPEMAKIYLDKLEVEVLASDLAGRYYALLGEAEVGLKEYDMAVLDLEQALQLLGSTSKTSVLEIEQVRNLIGLAYYNQGKYRAAIEQHERCMRSINQGRIEDTRFKMKVYANLANEYHCVGDNQQALQLYREAAKLGEGGEDNNALAKICWGLGVVYRQLDNLAMAKLYLAKSAGLYDKMGELREACTVKGILGLAMVERDELAEAEKVLLSALETASLLNDTNALYSAHANLAYLYYKQGKLAQAEVNCETASTKARNLGNNLQLGQALAQMAEIKIAQNAVETGLTFFEEAVTTLEKIEANEYLKRICFRYATALEKLGMLREALEIFRKAYHYQNLAQKDVPS